MPLKPQGVSFEAPSSEQKQQGGSRGWGKVFSFVSSGKQLQEVDDIRGRNTKTLVLRDLLEDTRDYWGIFWLFWFLAYFIYTIMFIGSSWSENGAVFHAGVMNDVRQFGSSKLTEQHNMKEAFEYGTGYGLHLLHSAQDRRLPDSELYLNQYTRIQLMRLVVDVDSSCNFPQLHCYKSAGDAELFGYEANATGRSPMPSGLWSPLPEPAYWAYGSLRYHYVNFYNTSANGTSFASAISLLDKALREDTAFIGRYAISMQLELVAQHDYLWKGDPSHVFFGVEWNLKKQMFDRSLSAFEMITNTATVPLKEKFVSSDSDHARLVLLVIYIIWILGYLARQSDEVRLCMKQYRLQAIVAFVRKHGADLVPGRDLQLTYLTLYKALAFSTSQKERKQLEVDASRWMSEHWKDLKRDVRTATISGLWRYCSSGWNLIDILSSLVSFLWAAGWLYIIVTASMSAETFSNFLSKPLPDFHKFMNFCWIFNSFIFIGILNSLLVGIRLYKYLQFHSGMRIYYHLIQNAWRAIKDFGLWFIYVMLVLGSTVIMVFQISGGNDRFKLRWEGINSMALMTFGYLDYKAFTNETAGVGAWGPMIIAIFWLAVAILGTVALNIVIAIVGIAYEEAKDAEGPVEFTFVYLSFWRLVWGLIYVYRVWIWRWPEERLAHYWVSIVINEINTDPLSTTHHFRETKKTAWFAMRTCRLFARWGLALLPEVKTLLQYYSDASNTVLCNRSPWEDGEAVEEMLTDLSGYKRRKKVPMPNHIWTIDTAMTHNHFMLFMLAFASSGTCGLPQGSEGEAENVDLSGRDLESPGEDASSWSQAPLNYPRFKLLASKLFPEQLVDAETYWLMSPGLIKAYLEGTTDESRWQSEVKERKKLASESPEPDLPLSNIKRFDEPADSYETSVEFIYRQAMAPLDKVFCPHKTAALQVLEGFRDNPFLGLWILNLSARNFRWSREKTKHLATWIWAVYASEQLPDHDWSADMEDVDFKLLDLKDWFAAELERKLPWAAPPARSSRASRTSRLNNSASATRPGSSNSRRNSPV